MAWRQFHRLLNLKNTQDLVAVYALPRSPARATGAAWFRSFAAQAQKLEIPVYHLHPLTKDEEQPDERQSPFSTGDALAKWTYTVEVVTGDVRGAGTPNMATMQIFGSTAVSALYRIGDDGDNEAQFERNLLPCVKPIMMPCDTATHKKAASIRGAGVAIPHPEKVKDGKRGVNARAAGFAGEDAYFYTPGSRDMFGLGVADGVYMWREHGIDAGVFARTLMDTAQHLVEAGYSDVVRIAEICQRKVDTEGIYGSSTFCLAVVERRLWRMHTACLGDSGIMVIGSTSEDPEPHVKFRTAPQEHEFGWPYQLGHLPTADRPQDCMLASVRVQSGDIVILGSDGLWDNVFDREIAATALKYQTASSAPNPSALVRELASTAYTRSQDRAAFTPYSYAASEWFDMVYNGGKKDDISVVAAFIE